MKKLLMIGFLLIAAISSASHSRGQLPTPVVTIVEKPDAEMVKQDKEMMSKYLTSAEVAEVEKNRTEIKILLEAKEPDWKKIEALSDKNALIMSKLKTKMMQEGYKK